MSAKPFNLTSFAIGLVLGGALVGAWSIGNTLHFISTEAPAAEIATSTTMVLPPTSGAIAVSDQAAGTSVLIDSVTVPPPGVWVAVREAGDGTELGNILGAARAHGPMSNLTIPLLRPTQSGVVYAVELYRDDGDGAFDPSTDSVYVDFDTGQRVVVLFKAK